MADGFWSWKSWVESANDPAAGSALQCLPYCSFVSSTDRDGDAHLGVGIGSFILDLHELSRAGLLSPLDSNTQAACVAPQLNPLMRCGPPAWSALRQVLIELLKEDASLAGRGQIEASLVPTERARFLKPVAVQNYTDFYASVHHATNVGRLFRPNQPLLPNYKWLPVGYHGRASSLVISGTGIRRPHGQTRMRGGDIPEFGPTSQLDYELEVAAYIGMGNALGCANLNYRSRSPPLRPLARERLVSARCAVMGVSAAGPLSRQEFCHQHLALGRPDGGAASVPSSFASSPVERSRAAPLPWRPVFRSGWWSRHEARGLALHQPHAASVACSGSSQHQQPSRSLLDVRSDARASHQQRLQSCGRRPDCQRNCLRTS